jgi:glutathione S-transferase
MPRLLFAPTSPYVRKVMVCAHLGGIAPQLELVDSAAHPIRRDPAIAAHNPVGKVPTLVLDDGQALYDSPVICEYLAHLAGDGHLFPAPGPARWTALTRQALGDGLLDAALLARYEQTARPAPFQWADWREALLTKVQACLAAIDALAPELALQQPSIGEVSIGCALGYLDFRFPELQWRSHHGQAAHWDEGFQRLPAMQATQPREAART